MSTDQTATDGWTVTSSPSPDLPPPQPEPQEQQTQTWPRAAVVTVATLAALLAAIVVFWVGFTVGDSGDEPAAAPESEPSAAPAPDADQPAAGATDGEQAEAEARDDDPADGAGAADENATPSEDAADGADAVAQDDAAQDDEASQGEQAEASGDDPAAESSAAPRVQGPDELRVRRAVLQGGTVYLQGRVPSQAIADEIAGKVAQVVGPDNVVVEYTVDPEAPVPASAPLFVADKVLFSSGSADIRPEFTPLLDLGVSLLTRFPDATVSIIGHTDPVGSEASNLRLSQRRVDAVVAYMTQRGVPAEQLLGEARGEAEALTGENASAGELAASRRTEFVVNGLLDG